MKHISNNIRVFGKSLRMSRQRAAIIKLQQHIAALHKAFGKAI